MSLNIPKIVRCMGLKCILFNYMMFLRQGYKILNTLTSFNSFITVNPTDGAVFYKKKSGEAQNQ